MLAVAIHVAINDESTIIIATPAFHYVTSHTTRAHTHTHTHNSHMTLN